ncbi:MAG: multicopper oxidase family protein [Pseudomonadota bacterium]
MTRTVSRRAALGLIGAATALPLVQSRAVDSVAAAKTDLHIQSARYRIVEGETRGLVSTRSDGPPPVLRLQQGRRFDASVTNGLNDYTAMHWHGLRVPNAMDGVPYLTQFPIAQNERFDYSFTPREAGTYWYHPHCMTMDQMALGLTGVLVVDEPDDPGFDAEIVLNLRDFRLRENGEWLDLWTARGAARGGTFGTVMTANWQQEPVYYAPAGGLVRLRLAATDTTRIYKIFLQGANGRIIASDGHPLRVPLGIPSEETPHLLAPGQRVDFAVPVPRTEGEEFIVMTRGSGGGRPLARIRAQGTDLGRDLRELAPLPANPIQEPDLSAARVEEFVFGWSPDDELPNNGFCGTLGYTFWSVNRKPWPGDAATGTGPLATLRRGESVVLRLRNESPNSHPIHLHGLIFRPIASNKRDIPSNWTDTALLQREETLDVALVADNPGDWAFHCHVIEHQKTGLAGFLRVLDT